MNLELNNTFKFTFIDKFEKLNNIYTAISIQSFYDINLQGIDLFPFFYEKAGLTQSDWDTDKKTYSQVPFAKLYQADQVSNIIYIPLPDNIEAATSILKYYPDSSISEYSNLMLTIDLGATNDTDLAKSVILGVAEIIAYTQGISVAPRLMVYSKSYLTAAEYAAVETAREAVKRNTTSYYSKCQELERQLITYGDKIVALELLVSNLTNQKNSEEYPNPEFESLSEKKSFWTRKGNNL